MTHTKHTIRRCAVNLFAKRVSSLAMVAFSLIALGVFVAAPAVQAVSPLPPNPQSGSVGIEGTISSPPPSRGPTITSPGNGQTFSTLPVVVRGICPEGDLIKIFSNNIFLGSTECKGGSFTLNVDLFNGQNDLVARVYDALDQAGPDSNTVRVTFNDPSFAAFGGRVTLTSNYARLGADPGKSLVWPIILAGGTGPYALSVDWGDGKPLTLKSVPFAGNLNIDHVYDAAGIYRIIVKATDSNGTTAYLQLVGVANGTVGASGKTASGKDKVITVTKTQIVLWPSIVAIFLILLAFWVGRRYELLSIRKRIERSSEEY
jgi:hypothetical protein